VKSRGGCTVLAVVEAWTRLQAVVAMRRCPPQLRWHGIPGGTGHRKMTVFASVAAAVPPPKRKGVASALAHPGVALDLIGLEIKLWPPAASAAFCAAESFPLLQPAL